MLIADGILCKEKSRHRIKLARTNDQFIINKKKSVAIIKKNHWYVLAMDFKDKRKKTFGLIDSKSSKSPKKNLYTPIILIPLSTSNIALALSVRSIRIPKKSSFLLTSTRENLLNPCPCTTLRKF